ncbi:hypothetical protein A2856_00310 [Candidatus Uhrbacteria bacterium RIFCSPHIGHO2_01_FULL_63_20]|uniref:Methyltransferase type 11 domain-containing protein n=1 Tax=Candidatus Uhrbacteria bacterium RIFCSPHIGHO2_01_FULL_63_20 TaxID=1802385 RepID=A0A1F7TN08_9BACT|nr:MAG: hypothetical protein A2856_00310 [Candidatus Uhrbacteria bacterium RIFCSPHIGHO2_01_FULL_63_20]
MPTASYRKWRPQDYLRHYYATKDVAEDERYIFDFIIKFLGSEGDFSEMLEVGAGPTIHHVTPFAGHVGKIYLAEYLPSNIREVKKWIRGDDAAHDWRPYVEGVIRLEGGRVTPQGVRARIRLLKKKIVRVFRADLFKALPLGRKKQFPLVTSFYCVECVSSSKARWESAMKNLAGLVAPGGWLILSALRKSRSYKSGNFSFPSANVHEKDVRDALRKHGFDPRSLDVRSHRVSQWEEEGFTGIILCKAKKLV